MHKRINCQFNWVLVVLFACVAGCSRLNPEQQALLSKIEEKWGEQYDIKLSRDGLYLEVRCQSLSEDLRADMEEIYAAYSFEKYGEIRPKGFVYLNVFNSEKTPLWQLYFHEGSFITNNVIYY